MKNKNLKIVVFLFSIIILFPREAHAGMFDLGGSFGYDKSFFAQDSYTWTRRYTLSLGYYFTPESEVELMYQNTTTREVVPGIQDTTFYDQVYSADFVYQFFRNGLISPLLRAGVGQLYRNATGTYGGYTLPGEIDSITIILGTGIRIKVTQNFGLKAEATTYLVGGSIATWSDNLSISAGISLLF